MKADKSEAISSLVTMIKDQILTVESKFLQDQSKYRKLEWIFKDDYVCSTSTNCINFLMRFLKFIALFLDNYALNADGDVKGMFETAYSSLLKAHPDLKSLTKHSNLLESVPSNEEFKSLLGNPKNIKDCGKSLAESLMILPNRWHKLSVSPTLLV
uniref:Glycolipid transfer protein domain-containing protein n=1 Tax=Quercus lobata TaxID=97700 RepID=A0A7N2MWH1_QUELO